MKVNSNGRARPRRQRGIAFRFNAGTEPFFERCFSKGQ
jgi:hypothetical protein